MIEPSVTLFVAHGAPRTRNSRCFCVEGLGSYESLPKFHAPSKPQANENYNACKAFAAAYSSHLS
jgi:hypothetical protein